MEPKTDGDNTQRHAGALSGRRQERYPDGCGEGDGSHCSGRDGELEQGQGRRRFYRLCGEQTAERTDHGGACAGDGLCGTGVYVEHEGPQDQSGMACGGVRGGQRYAGADARGSEECQRGVAYLVCAE